ncbi:lantibiotic dehydratase [Streptomyces sp. NPDC013161]|uniref:lantibiotic dehydratase n=1 Tax=Streptomyces sp. NPDC013161 TaxID=3364862 RepID=UPI0036AAAACC
MGVEGKFRATGPALLRIASFRRRDIDFPALSYLHGEPENPTVDELLAYIAELLRRPGFREAVEIASPSLVRTLQKIDDNARVSRKKLLSTAVSLTRYLLRMSGRPTPFGLHAGVVAASVGATARAVFDGVDVKQVRLDAGWFAAQVDRWLDVRCIRHNVEVVSNDLCVVRGDRLVVPYTAHPSAGQEVSLRNSPVVSWVRSRTERPVVFGTLLRETAEKFPHLAEERLDALLLQLIRNDALVTSLSPGALDDNFLTRTYKILAESPQELERLQEIQSALEEFRDAAAGDGMESWRRAVALSEAEGGEGGPVAQVDLRVAADVTVPHSVLTEIEKAATVLWAMAPRGEQLFAHMQEYFAAFVEAYGEGGAVRLVDLVDPHRGLGFPRGYRNPSTVKESRLAVHERVVDESRDLDRHELMLGLLSRGMVSPDREVVLDDEDVAAFAGLVPLTDNGETDTPDSFELCFQLLAESTQHLDEGQFRLVASPMVGHHTVGASMGRFTELVGLRDALAQLSKDAAPPGTSVAQLVFRPKKSRSLNVTQVAEIAPYEIPIGRFSDRLSERSIDWKDLVVVADESRLRVLHGRTGDEIFPVAPHSLNMKSQSPNLARFLSELRYTDESSILPIWNWSGLGQSPWLPRVRLGNVVLSPLRWYPSPALREAAHSPHRWETALTRWQSDLKVHDRVRIVDVDRTYEIDLRQPFHRELLRREIADGVVKVTESPHELGSYDWCDGRSNELVVPLLRNHRGGRRPASTGSAPVLTPKTRHALDSEWFYAQVLAIPEIHEQIILTFGEMIRDLASDIDKWFFVRYADPDPQLRLRVKAAPGIGIQGLTSQLLRRLEELRGHGVIREIRICAYEPETVRYGGPTAVDSAEALFSLDSETVVAELGLLRGQADISSKTLMVANYGTLLDAIGPGTWPVWAGKAFPRSTNGEVTREEIEEAARIVVPGASAANLSRTLDFDGLRSAWQESEAPSRFRDALLAGPQPSATTSARRWDMAVLSLLHMQHNRLIGTDRVHEKKSLMLLGHVARAHVGREQHRRQGA